MPGLRTGLRPGSLTGAVRSPKSNGRRPRFPSVARTEAHHAKVALSSQGRGAPDCEDRTGEQGRIELGDRWKPSMESAIAQRRRIKATLGIVGRRSFCLPRVHIGRGDVLSALGCRLIILGGEVGQGTGAVRRRRSLVLRELGFRR